MSGPLSGIRVIEFAGLGPGPFCGMMLADHGAEVIRIDRPGQTVDAHDVLLRSRRSIALNLKSEEGRAAALDLCASGDGLIEGFRPGVMERLGLGPEEVLSRNRKMVYGRMTGWGQSGPLANAAGHDINYISLSGILHTVGAKSGAPVPPANYLGDFAGGGMMLAFGMVSALLCASRTGVGQVIDCAMTEGSALIAAMIWGEYNAGRWRNERGVNWLDGGAHFYNTYQCKDGKYISIGSIEPQFYALLRDMLDLSDDCFFRQMDEAAWPGLTQRIAEVFKTRTQNEWVRLLEGSDVCFAPVLDFENAPQHPHNAARGSFVKVGGDVQPAPTPRYSASGLEAPRPVCPIGADTDEILTNAGWSKDRIAAARDEGAIA